MPHDTNKKSARAGRFFLEKENIKTTKKGKINFTDLGNEKSSEILPTPQNKCFVELKSPVLSGGCDGAMAFCIFGLEISLFCIFIHGFLRDFLKKFTD